MNISLIDIEEKMPAKVVLNDFFGGEEERKKNRMFSGTSERRHMERDELASDYLADAAKVLINRLNLNPQTDIDLILTNISMPDEVFTGCGAVVNKKIGGGARWIVDMHNTGCVSFLYLLEMAQTYMKARNVRHALVCVGQTAGGRMFGQPDTRLLAQAAIPGDGFAVAYVTQSDERPILSMEFQNYPEHSEDMFLDYDGAKWWEARTCSGKVNFNEENSVRIVTRGNAAVPKVIHHACKSLQIKSTEIDFLITNQPNMTFLRNWREAALLPAEKHLHTFEKYANLFGAGIPVTMAEAIKSNTIKPGNLVCLAGFSHACDYAGAVLVRW